MEKLITWYKNQIDYLTYLFEAECYESFYGKSERFPSLFSLVVRFLIRYLYVLVPVICVGMIILGFVEAMAVYQILIVAPIATVLVLLAICIAFAVLMLIESFCTIIASLILYEELPTGAENPPDALLMHLIQ